MDANYKLALANWMNWWQFVECLKTNYGLHVMLETHSVTSVALWALKWALILNYFMQRSSLLRCLLPLIIFCPRCLKFLFVYKNAVPVLLYTEVSAYLSSHCDQTRIMMFLQEGIKLSKCVIWSQWFSRPGKICVTFFYKWFWGLPYLSRTL